VHGGLRGVVGRLPLRPVNDHGRNRADVDDGAATVRLLVRAGRLGDLPQRPHINVEDGVPLFVGYFQCRAVKADAGIVDNNVDTAEQIDGPLDDLGGLGCDVAPQRDRFKPEIGHILVSLPVLFLVARYKANPGTGLG